ncbi:photosystem II assembly protein Psb35 [Vacuolonema iberomarrocanum]|uniref:photosystem II assembly protein Psb35 n=1 Tax=Vacuolonema iberomarrocanum TaxID=3454632 RepID=UPI001A051FE9|nr:hypothetical protein [filamentous cyanobacterium LEGE 07170]
MLNLIFAVAENASGGFPISFTLVYVIGFIAAVSIGSIAWYNSKRPPGWEGKDRPDVVPKVDSEVGEGEAGTGDGSAS